MLNKLFDLIYPKGIKCIFCGDDINNDEPICICDNCKKTLPKVKGKLCSKCGQMIETGDVCLDCKSEYKVFERAFSPLIYTGVVRERLFAFKYSNAKYLAEPFGSFMYNKLIEEKILFDFIIPVPLSDNRKKARGYNQAELLAKVIADKTNKPLLTDYLVRIKDTPFQAKSSKEQRKDSIQGAFAMHKRKGIKDKTILLIDDIYTTGATSNECSKKILGSGASRVYVLTLAHTPIEKKE